MTGKYYCKWVGNHQLYYYCKCGTPEKICKLFEKNLMDGAIMLYVQCACGNKYNRVT